MSYADQIRTEPNAKTMRSLIANGIEENKSIADVATLTASEAKSQVLANDSRINNIIVHNGDGTKDTEVIDGRLDEVNNVQHSSLSEHFSTINSFLNGISKQDLPKKADVTYVDTKIASISSGSPKAVFATLSALQGDLTANTIDGKKNIYLVIADGGWYYWNGAAWTLGGVYQSTGLSTSNQNSINNVSDISDYIISDRTANNLKKQVLVQNTDWTLNNVTISNVNNNLRISSVSGAYNAISKKINKMKFKISGTVGNTPFILLGIGNTYTAIGVHTGVQSRILEMTKAGISGQYTQLLAVNSSIAGAGAGDEVIVELSGTFVIVSIKRVGNTDFVELFRIDLSLYTGANGWLTSPCLGFVTVTTTFNEIDGNIYELNDLSIFKVGEDMTAAILNLDSRTKNLDLSSFNQRLDTQDQKIDGLQSQINILNPSTSQGRWFGKTWNVLGDSFTARNKYQDMVKNILGIGVINSYGVSGSTISHHPTLSLNPMSERYTSMVDAADIVTVWGGVNDYGNGAFGSQGGIDMGTINDTINTTFYGALRVLIEGLMTKYPTKKIAFILPTQMNQANVLPYKNGKDANAKGLKLEQYCQAIREVCELYSIPYLDLYKAGGLNERNMVQLTEDGLHPNTDGFTFLSYRIAKFLEQI